MQQYAYSSSMYASSSMQQYAYSSSMLRMLLLCMLLRTANVTGLAYCNITVA